MSRIPLQQFVDHEGWNDAATKLGCTAPAIRKAIKADREIYVIRTEEGFRGEEVKPFPSQGKDAEHPTQ